MGSWLETNSLLLLIVFLIQLAGILAAILAIMETRTAQGAIGWAISLLTIPYLALPLYLLFGRTRFNGYVRKRRMRIGEANPHILEFIRQAYCENNPVQGDSSGLVEKLTRLPATAGNEVTLLLNGEQIFPSILEGIDRAQNYLLVQFYIVRDDAIGRDVQSRLIQAAQRGVRVYFLYDYIGSLGLSNRYIQTLAHAGVRMVPFRSTRVWYDRLQINFRNHRKIVIADGKEAWVGGANIGDEYLDRDPRMSPWLDTMVKVTGPAVQMIQVPFIEDWYWANGEIPELDWQPSAAPSGLSQRVLCIPSSPADHLETCTFHFLHLIHSAQRRIWIASPYFVPDEQTVSALQMASLRGVDVRILIPDRCDNTLVRLSAWSYLEDMDKAGVRIFRLRHGFLHYKAMLCDDWTGTIGTANFDNRSFRLNFEITLQVEDHDFARAVEAMFERDFAHCKIASLDDLKQRSFLFRLAVRTARLMAPIQ